MQLSLMCFTAAALALLMGSPAAAGATVAISGRSPLAGCNVADEPGANYLDSVAEARLAADPSNPRRLIAGWQQDLWDLNGARGHVSAFSIDGGKSWKRVVVPGVSKCSGGKGDLARARVRSPGIAISPNGTAYFVSLAVGYDGSTAVLVNRSASGTTFWENPVVLRRDDQTAFNFDPSIVADPRDPRYVYAVWDQRGFGAAGSSGYRAALARSSDGGKTWDSSEIIGDAAADIQSIGSRAVVLPNGSLLVFYNQINFDGSTSIRVMRSTDHGRHFSPPSEALVGTQNWYGVYMPNTLTPVQDASYIFDVATDPASGRVYLVWQDYRQPNATRVAFALSADGGATWSSPILVNKTPETADGLLNQAFIPSVGVAANGSVYVSYYDFRNDSAKDAKRKLADAWAISCRAGADCSKATSWGNETRLTQRSFNMFLAPPADSRGAYIGKRQALAPQGSGVRALFTATTGPYTNSILNSAIR